MALGSGVAGSKPQDNNGSGKGTTSAGEKNHSSKGAPSASTQGLAQGNGHLASGLTITFSGDANAGMSEPWVPGALSGQPVDFCTSDDRTSCVSFPVGSAPDTSKVLLLDDALGPQTVYVYLASSSWCEVFIFTSAPTTVAGALGTGAVDSPSQSSFTTTSTWENGETLFWTHDSGC